MSKDPLFVTALARGLDVLRCFTPERQELGTSEIARLTGLPQPTVWRLCNTLQQQGCLMQGNAPHQLRIGAGVLLLGHAAIVHSGVSEVALPEMQALADAYEASVSLAERSGTRMVIIQRAEAPNIVKVNLHIGSAIEIGNSSLGLAYLAAVAQSSRSELLDLIRDEIGEQRWPSVDRDVREAQAEFELQGFVFNLGNSHRDINAVGVPVVSTDGKRTLALTCGGARSRLTRARLEADVVPSLKALAAKLGPLLSIEAQLRRT